DTVTAKQKGANRPLSFCPGFAARRRAAAGVCGLLVSDHALLEQLAEGAAQAAVELAEVADQAELLTGQTEIGFLAAVALAGFRRAVHTALMWPHGKFTVQQPGAAYTQGVRHLRSTLGGRHGLALLPLAHGGAGHAEEPGELLLLEIAMARLAECLLEARRKLGMRSLA